jgi:hypothetical protein
VLAAAAEVNVQTRLSQADAAPAGSSRLLVAAFVTLGSGWHFTRCLRIDAARLKVYR